MTKSNLLGIGNCVFFAATTLTSGVRAAPLTYDVAIELADHTAPVVQARAADVKATRSAAIAAGRLPDPRVSFGVNDFPISGPLAGRPDLDNFSMLTLDFAQDVPNGAKRRAGRSRAAADISQAEAAQNLERRRVRIAAGLAWIDLYYAERRLAALDQVGRAIAPLRSTAPAGLASGALRPAQTVEPEQLAAALADR
ncbi:MAG: TolC family protein, partial [Caulobacteraceae bacterium]